MASIADSDIAEACELKKQPEGNIASSVESSPEAYDQNERCICARFSSTEDEEEEDVGKPSVGTRLSQVFEHNALINNRLNRLTKAIRDGEKSHGEISPTRKISAEPIKEEEEQKPQDTDSTSDTSDTYEVSPRAHRLASPSLAASNVSEDASDERRKELETRVHQLERENALLSERFEKAQLTTTGGTEAEVRCEVLSGKSGSLNTGQNDGSCKECRGLSQTLADQAIYLAKCETMIKSLTDEIDFLKSLRKGSEPPTANSRKTGLVLYSAARALKNVAVEQPTAEGESIDDLKDAITDFFKGNPTPDTSKSHAQATQWAGRVTRKQTTRNTVKLHTAGARPSAVTRSHTTKIETVNVNANPAPAADKEKEAWGGRQRQSAWQRRAPTSTSLRATSTKSVPAREKGSSSDLARSRRSLVDDLGDDLGDCEEV